MKKTYRQPYIDVTAIDMELLLTTGSEKTSTTSVLTVPSGRVRETCTMTREMVLASLVPRSITLMRSGATKEPYFYSSLGRAENEESCLPGEETRYTLQVYQIFRQRGCVRFF